MREGFIHRQLVQPVVALLTQGITPEKIALSLAMGIVLGVFPVLGSTTLLCAVAAAILRLNLPAIQLVNFIVYPLQLVLLVPFMRAGEFLFRARTVQLSPMQIVAMARADLPHAISSLWLAYVHAISAWLLAGPVMMLLLYILLAYLVRRAGLLALASQGAGSPASQPSEVKRCS